MVFSNSSELHELLEKLKKSEIAEKISRRMRVFSSFRNKSNAKLFNELCFCLLTANYSAEGGMKIQKKIANGFLSFSLSELAGALKNCGYRFPNTRASYIVEARRHKDFLKKLFEFKNGKDAREWLVKNIKGLGYKEASHFLRNIGFRDVAIIDFHIIDVLRGYGFIRKPKTLTRKRYLAIEKKLEKIAKEAKLSLGELDLYLWYLETGKILK
jgi:N-glycosylase/DNA lyase